MKALIQRVLKASVEINNKIYSQINNGYLVFVGVEKDDCEKQAQELAQKIINLRIFEDENQKMNLSITDITVSNHQE